MLRSVKLQWRDLKCAKPGTRFRQRYRARQRRGRSYFAKPLYMMAGFSVFVVGVVLLVAPGPGFLVGFVGAAMMAEESYGVARLLDWLEIKVRRSLVRGRRTMGRRSAADDNGSVFSKEREPSPPFKSSIHLPR